MSECKFKEHDFDWDNSQECQCCGIKERDYLDNQLQQKDKVIEILKSACEFYADVESWNIRHAHETEREAKSIVSRDYEFIPQASRSFGGKIARQALKQIEDLTQKEKE